MYICIQRNYLKFLTQWSKCSLNCRLEEIQSPTKKLPPESTPYIFFTGFEPTQVQQFMKVIVISIFVHSWARVCRKQPLLWITVGKNINHRYLGKSFYRLTSDSHHSASNNASDVPFCLFRGCTTLGGRSQRVLKNAPIWWPTRWRGLWSSSRRCPLSSTSSPLSG